MDCIVVNRFIYEHQPDLAEWFFTKDCYCSGTNLTLVQSPSMPKQRGEVVNFCHYNSPTGPFAHFAGEFSIYDPDSASHGIYFLARHVFSFVENNYYQVLDIVDNTHALVYVCSAYPIINKPAYCIYFLSKVPCQWTRFACGCRGSIQGCDQQVGHLRRVEMGSRLQGPPTPLLELDIALPPLGTMYICSHSVRSVF
eukprot:TRINITY_DN4841_c0_g3_i2.p1 TRINITY_DN4841_c0_g3~~TRINITY_DN4841_c0_g3_i2.p1  ORF type:complete len:197 (-),score=13.85 TRINITY_DN4841_c0_g3_i2:77-667(-)